MGLFDIFGGGSGNNISPQEAKKRMDESGKFVLLDVRTPAEYKQVHIEGAKLIPLDTLESRATVDLPDKNVPIYIYCLSGGRAGSAVRMLTNMGYTEVYNFGGISNWPYEKVQG